MNVHKIWIFDLRFDELQSTIFATTFVVAIVTNFWETLILLSTKTVILSPFRNIDGNIEAGRTRFFSSLSNPWKFRLIWIWLSKKSCKIHLFKGTFGWKRQPFDHIIVDQFEYQIRIWSGSVFAEVYGDFYLVFDPSISFNFHGELTLRNEISLGISIFSTLDTLTVGN